DPALVEEDVAVVVEGVDAAPREGVAEQPEALLVVLAGPRGGVARPRLVPGVEVGEPGPERVAGQLPVARQHGHVLVAVARGVLVLQPVGDGPVVALRRARAGAARDGVALPGVPEDVLVRAGEARLGLLDDVLALPQLGEGLGAVDRVPVGLLVPELRPVAAEALEGDERRA